MKCIILGSGGQLGREWMHRLKSSKSGIAKTDVEDYSGYRSRELDITNKQEIIKALEEDTPDVVINCAAYTNVDQAEEDRDEAQKINGMAVKFLAEQCAARNVKLVHYSTDYVFPGNKEDRERFPDGYPEDHPTDPVNWYGATKLIGEQAIRSSGAHHLILRVSWLCGQFGSNFVTTMLRLAGERDELQVVNDQWGSPTFTGHVVENTLTLLRKAETGTFHLTSRGVLTWYVLARKIFEIKQLDVKVNPVSSEEFASKAPRPAFSKLDPLKFEQHTGSEVLDWRIGLKQLLAQLGNR